MPQRIQRKRTKGWRMPENTVCVTRPGKYGNPFAIGGFYKIGTGGSGTFMWLRCLLPEHNDGSFIKIETREQAIDFYKRFREVYPLTQKEIAELKGKNLACFCKEGELCHADVLLELANQ
jgi:hypothetical protein